MNTETANVPKVYSAIDKVREALANKGIAKARKNEQQNYQFRGIEDVYAVLSHILVANKLNILPRCLTRTETERQARSGGAIFAVVVEVEFDLISSEDGSKHVVRTFGEAMDSADKATNKAMSAAYKYMAFLTFSIPVKGETVDADLKDYKIKPSGEKPADTSKVKDTGGKVSALQCVALMKAWRANGWTDEMVASYLVEKFEINTTKEIKVLDYPTIMTHLSNKPK